MMKSMISRTKGSFVVEASITFPIFIIVILICIRFLLIFQLNIKIDRILFEMVCEVQSTSVMKYIKDADIIDISIEREKTKEILNNILKDKLSKNQINNLKEYELKFKEIYPGNLDSIWLELSYDMYGLNISKEIRFDVIRYGQRVLKISDVWNMAPMIRGRLIISRFGGNMPYNYPLVSRFKSGEAAVIKSINPDAISYLKNDAIYLKMKTYIDKLFDLEGLIEGEKIYSKKFIVIMPSNAKNKNVTSEIDKLKRYAKKKNVDFELILYGELIETENGDNLPYQKDKSFSINPLTSYLMVKGDDGI